MATKIFLNNDWQDYDYDTLYSTLGYTKIKCDVYAKEGDYVWSWYNPVMREYWDDREWKKLWTPIPPKPLDEIPFLVFDNGLGRIVHTTEEDILSYSDIPPHFISDSLMSYSDISVTTISDITMITTLELGVAVQSFFFTNKGNKETENSEKWGSVSGFIYDETGHLIVGEDIDAGYDNAPVLSLTQVDGNMLSPINGDYIYMSSTRRNWYFHPESGTRFVWSLQVERINPTPPPEIVLKALWGERVNVPDGYEPVELRTFVAYVPRSYAEETGNYFIVAYSGKNVYSDDLTDSMLQEVSHDSPNEWPMIEVFQGTSINNYQSPKMQGTRLTIGWPNSTANWTFHEKHVNGTDSTAGDYSVYMKGSNVPFDRNNSYPARYLYFIYDSTISGVTWLHSPEAFKVPHSLWSFSDGTFSWLGNTSDQNDLAWYYAHDWEDFSFSSDTGMPYVYIHCVKRSDPEIKTAYFNDEGASETENVYVGRNTNYSLYDEFGVKIPYSDTTHYEIVGVYKFDGTRLDTSSEDYIRADPATPLSLLWHSNVLPETGRYYYAFRLRYREYPVSLAYAQNKASVTVYQGSSITLYSDDGQTPITYDPNKQYILCMVTGGIPYNLYPVTAELYCDSNNHLAFKNTSSNNLSFKYLTYRVVNRTVETAYFTNQGSSGTTDTTMVGLNGGDMYDSSGTRLYYNNLKNYVIVGIFDYAGNAVPFDTSRDLVTGVGGYLYFYSDSTKTAYRIQYALEEKAHTDIVLFMPGDSSHTYYYQTGVTKNDTRSPNPVYPLYTDTACTQQASLDVNKRYEIGNFDYVTGNWIPNPIQSKKDMPETTVSDTSLDTDGSMIVASSSSICYITNYTSTSYWYSNNTPIRIRIRVYET